MVTVVTNTGFECTVDERRFADFRVVDLCGVVLGDSGEADKVLAGTSLLHFILTDDQIKALCSHVEKDGFVSTDDVFAEMFDILNKAKAESAEIKKS